MSCKSAADMSAQPAIHPVQDGKDIIFEAVAEAAGASRWDEISTSVKALLEGRVQAGQPTTWRLQELEAFQENSLPCWILRSIDQPGGPRAVMWCNHAAEMRLGRPRTEAEVLQWWEHFPEQFKAVSLQVLQSIHQNIIVDRQKLRINMNLSRTLHQNWTGLPRELYARLREEAIDVEIEGEVQTCSFCVIEKELSAEQLRSTAITTHCPIHSYLFNASGELLYATHNATLSLNRAGVADVHDFTLAKLLTEHGVPQHAKAQEALAAICRGKSEHHAVTLSNMSKGKLRHTLYEFWPARDPVDTLGSAVVVSAFDVTRQKETELELQSLKNALQRHNADLQDKVEEVVTQQAQLEAERLRLQSRLKDALQLHMAPRTQLDVTSPIDRTVALLDGFLEGRNPATQDVIALRNSLLQGSDLRRASNLEAQLKAQMHLTADASLSLFTLLQDSNRTSKHLISHASGGFTGWQHTRSFSNLVPSARVSAERTSKDLLENLSLPPVIITEVDSLLQNAGDSWSFDMVALDKASNGHSLSCFGFWLLQQSGLLTRYGIPAKVMADCLKAVEAGYRDNDYHNRIHAASVLHMSQLLVHCRDGLADTLVMEDVTELALYLAAITHDYGHPGVTNDFIIRSRHPLAKCYNDRSPLENYHASAALKVLEDHLESPDCQLESELLQTLRSAMIDNILATDMKQHFSLVSRLQGAFQAGAFAPANVAGPEDGASRARIQGLAAEHRLLAIQMALKCADLGHLALPKAQHKEWVGRLQEEFFVQGDRERLAGLPVSPLMERSKSSQLSSSQVGFFEIVAMPLLKSMAAAFPGVHIMLDAANQNYMMWRAESVKST